MIMCPFTYEEETSKCKLETYEWESVWLEKTENHTSKRVLYIGDSISCAVRHKATQVSHDEVLFDGFGTSKALDNPFFKASLNVFMKQLNSCDAILFNNGLHGWHLTDEEYKKYYAEMLDFFAAESEAPVVLLLTTDVANQPKRTERIITRNRAVCELAEERRLPVIDFFTISQELKDLHEGDGVHFADAGSTKLGEYLLTEIRKYF